MRILVENGQEGSEEVSVFVNNCRRKRFGLSIFLLTGEPTEALLRREP